MKKNKKVLAGVLAASMLTFGGVGSAFAATTSTAANGTTAYYIGTASSGTEYTSSYLLANPGTISTINSQLNSGFGLYFSLMGQPFINYKNFINSLNGQTPTTSALNVYATQSANQFTPPANTPVDGSTPALSVSSVSAINSTSVTVNFSAAVTAAEAGSVSFAVTGPNSYSGTATGTVAAGATTATLTFSTALTASCSYTIGGVSATYTAVTVSATNSSVTSFPASMTDGTAYNVAATVQDANGNPITGLTSDAFSLTVGNSSPISGTAVSLGSGQYQIVFVPTAITPSAVAQVATLSVSGITIGTQNVTVSSGSASSSTTTASFPAATVLNEGATYTINITPKDANGNATTISGTPTVTLGTGSQAVQINGSLGSPTNGVYPVTFSAPSATISTPITMTVKLGSLSYTSSGTYTVAAQTVTSMNVDLSSLPSTLTQGGSYSIPVTLEDANGNPVTLATVSSSPFTVSYASNSLTNSVTESSTPGVYNVAFTADSGHTGTVSPITVTYTGVTPNLTQTSTSSYTESTATATGAVSTASVTWPTLATLTNGTAYTATVAVSDANGNPVTGLASANFGVQQGSFATDGTPITTTVVPGTTAGTYTVTFTPSTVGTNQTFELGIGSTGSWTQYGTSFNATVQGTVSGVTLSSNLNSGILVAGQAVTIPVTTTGNQSNLTASNFSLSYNGSPVAITNVAYVSGGVYSVTFTAPSALNSTGATLGINVAGNTTTASGVTVESLSSITPTLTVTSAAGASSSVTSGGVTYTAPSTTSAALSMNSTYYLDTVVVKSGSYFVFGLPSSSFTAAIGSGSSAAPLSVVTIVPDMATTGQYDLVAKTGSTAVTSGTNVYVTVNGVASNDSASYTVAIGTPVAYNSTIAYPTGNLANQLTHGQSYTITCTLADSKGVPVTGLQSYNFVVGTSTTSGAITLSSALPTSSTPTVTAGSTAGTYTITFTPSTVNSTASYLGVLVNTSSTSGSSAAYNNTGSSVFVNVTNKATTVN